VTIQIHMPMLPPSANRLWVRAKKGMRKSDQYSAWITEAGWHVKAQRPGRIEGPYKISIHAVKPDKRARDISNLIKSLEDLLQHVGVIENDSLCEQLGIRWVTIGHGLTVYIDRAGTEDVI
jgi:crossover junction endodeoxyribonuclease RusA